MGGTPWISVRVEICSEYAIAQKGRLRPFAVCQVLTFAKDIKVLILINKSLACETLGVLSTLFGLFEHILPKNHCFQIMQVDFKYHLTISKIMFLSKYSLDFVFTLRIQPSGEYFDENMIFDLVE